MLTHGEPHRGDTVGTGSGVVLVDWDTCPLAPPERDLWMVAGETSRSSGSTRNAPGRVDRRLLEAYRLRWDLADVDACVRDLRAPHVEDDDTRTAGNALRGVLGGGVQPKG